MHVGHLLNKTLKDFYIKYYLKNGYKVFVRFGCDCHGLPIENRAKNMPGNLLENCKQIAESYSQIQKNTLSLFGIYSTDKDYLTLSDDFVKRELNIFNKLKESGYVFKKNKPTWYSPSLNTVTCCAQCNTAKLNFTLDEFKIWIESVYNKIIKDETFY